MGMETVEHIPKCGALKTWTTDNKMEMCIRMWPVKCWEISGSKTRTWSTWFYIIIWTKIKSGYVLSNIF